MLQTISTTQVDDPMTLLLGSMLAMSLQQPLWLLHFCATCGHCTGDGQTGRKPGARRGTVPLGGMRGVSGRDEPCHLKLNSACVAFVRVISPSVCVLACAQLRFGGKSDFATKYEDSTG